MPPLTWIVAPVTQAASSDARYTTAAAMSSGWPIRPSGIAFGQLARCASVSASVIAVSHEARRHHVHRNARATPPPAPAPCSCQPARPWRRRNWPGPDCPSRPRSMEMLHDPPRAPPQHAPQRRPRQPERRRQIDVQHRLPILILHPQRQHVAREAGIVDQDVPTAPPPPPPPPSAHRRLAASRRSAGQTYARSPSSAASPSSASRRVPDSTTTAPLRMQRPRDRRADAARGAGHQRRLAVQPEHPRSPTAESSAAPRSPPASRPATPAHPARCA